MIMVTTETNQHLVEDRNSNTKKIVAFPARLMPLHNGHKDVLLGLTRDFDKVVIILGSVFETGTARNCILASEREKAVHAVFKRAGISPSCERFTLSRLTWKIYSKSGVSDFRAVQKAV